MKLYYAEYMMIIVMKINFKVIDLLAFHAVYIFCGSAW